LPVLEISTDDHETIAIPPSLVVEENEHDIAVDWYQVYATTAGDPLGFDDAAQMAYKGALSNALDNTVPVSDMVLITEDSSSVITLECAFAVPLASSDAVGSTLNSDTFVDTLTAAVSSASSYSLTDVSFSKVAENTEATSFHSLFGVSASKQTAGDAKQAASMLGLSAADEETSALFGRSPIAVSTAGILCVGLIAVAIKARSTAAARSTEAHSASAAEGAAGQDSYAISAVDTSLTPQLDML
jgi:hypothetical protein